MDKIIAAVSVIGAIAVIIILSQLDLNGFVTAVLVVIAIAVAIISLARIKPPETKPEESAKK
jgi:hypothetical protein